MPLAWTDWTLGGGSVSDGTTGFIRDICPFTTLGLFNRGIKDANRKVIAAELAKFLGVQEAVPDTFEGIPLLNNLKSWYFPHENKRAADHIDALWNVFAAGLKLADADEDEGGLRRIRPVIRLGQRSTGCGVEFDVRPVLGSALVISEP